MRTTTDIPEDIFREVKTRAVQQGTTLKNLMTQFILSGLAAKGDGVSPKARPQAPPVAIRRVTGQAQIPALSNRELNAILEAEDIEDSRASSELIRNKA